MEHSYRIENGALLLCNDIKSKCFVYLSFLHHSFTIIFIFISLFLTMLVTLIIYNKCIVNISLNECIPLGSIFATFGSAVISVLSIYCGKQNNLFQENLAILQEEISDLHSWRRWPFIKRYSKEKQSFFHNNYYILLNPQITFETGKKSLTVPIPSCIADSKDLWLVSNMLKMICYRKCYLKFIYGLNSIKRQEDLLIFDCVLMIYKNIIRYKYGTIIMWIGAEFIFSSILFSFFYGRIINFLQYSATYF